MITNIVSLMLSSVYTDEVARIVVDMAGTGEGAQEILKMWSTKARGPVAMPQLPHRLIRHCLHAILAHGILFLLIFY